MNDEEERLQAFGQTRWARTADHFDMGDFGPSPRICGAVHTRGVGQKSPEPSGNSVRHSLCGRDTGFLLPLREKVRMRGDVAAVVARAFSVTAQLGE